MKPSVRVVLCGSLLAGIIAIGTGVPFAPAVRDRLLRRDPLGALRDASRGWRPFRARLVGGFEHVPFAPTRGSGQLSADHTHASVELEAARLLLRAEATPTPDHLAEAAAARLYLGDEDRAISLFERAVHDTPRANLLANLAAAYLTRAERHDSTEDIVRAVDASARATESDSTLPEAWFNLGMSLQELGLAEAAFEAWSRAASLEPDGGWRTEAATAAKALDAQVRWDDRLDGIWRKASVDGSRLEADVEQEPDAVRHVFERRVLVEWARAIMESRSGADAWADRAEAIAERLLAATGDRQSVDSVSQVRRTCQHAATPACRGLLTAYLSYIDGRNAWDVERTSDAYAHFEAARRTMHGHQMPEAGWLDLHLAFRARYAGDFRRVEAIGGSVLTLAESRGYTAMAGRAQWLRGLVRYEEGRLGEAESSLRLALKGFERTRDRESQGGIHNLLADYHRILEESAVAWGHQRRALAVVPYSGTYKHNAFFHNAAKIATGAGLHRAALEFRRQGQRAMRAIGAPASLALAVGDEALDLAAIARPSDALAKLEEAQAMLNKAAESDAAALVRAWLAIGETRITVDSDPRRAVAAATRAIDFYNSHTTGFLIPEVLLLRGRAFAALGDDVRAESDWQQGISVSALHRGNSPARASRIRLHAARWEFYAALSDLEARVRNNPDKGLRVVEEGRALDLRGSRSLDTVKAPAPESGTPRPPPDTVVVSFAVSPLRTHVWVAHASGMTHYGIERSAEEIAGMIRSFREQLTSRAGDAGAAASAAILFDLLFGKARDILRSATRLLVIPDGPLSDLPFGALVDRNAGGYVIDRMSVLMSPSITFALSRTSHRDPPGIRKPRVLVVANPASQAGMPLPRLPGAADEADAIGRLYATRVLLTGAEATRKRWLEEVRRVDVLHFAAHAQPNRLRPELSRLFLAPDTDRPDGILFVEDIESLRLDQLRLVVLAVCESAVGASVRGEGVMSLARGFLYAGATQVVATLWRIDDATAPALFEAFHAATIRGLEAPEALREAQLSVRRRSPHAAMADWAAPVVVGRFVH